ncbi:MAG TPA: cell wall hydrolase [Caulobacteraceae bacterium]|nr:cell wall hydrolase [Caulobacteraceae bacterium]
MNLRLGLPVATILGASLLLAPSAFPQTITATSAVIRPVGAGPAVLVMPADQPAPIQRAILSESPPLHFALSLDRRVAAAGADVGNLDAELSCLAKAIHHEAANQSLKGQLALAQLIMNRVKSPLFPKTICAVVNQAGQFFHTARYQPHGADERWHTAVGIARIAREAAEPELVPGALFYHATYVRPHWAHRRAEVARIGQHVFYR